MKIQYREMTMACKNVEATKDFYQRLFCDATKVENHEFFYTMEDNRSRGNLCVVPHNGETKWDNAWLCLSTDDLPKSIEHLLEIGVQKDSIENFGNSKANGEPETGITFRDPDGRLLMLLFDDEI